jgi:preprotein translocase subunit SecB
MTAPQAGPQIQLAQILLERGEFSHREDYLTVPVGTPASGGDVQIEIQVQLANDRTKVLTRLRAHTHTQKEPLYRFDVVMVLLAEVASAPISEAVDRYITGSTVGFLVPFLREAVANLTSRGRFGPLWLQPINVQSLLNQVQSPKAGGTGPPEVTPKRTRGPRKSARRQA